MLLQIIAEMTNPWEEATPSPSSSAASSQDSCFTLTDGEDLESCAAAAGGQQTPEARFHSGGRLEQRAPQQRSRKRKSAGTEFQQALLQQQQAMMSQLDAAHKEEMDLRRQHLKVQEKLVDAMTRFFNKKN